MTTSPWLPLVAEPDVSRHFLTDIPSSRHWFRLALDNRRAASWARESIARTQFHFSRVLRAQNKDPDRASKNYLEAKTLLDQFLPLDLPSSLRDVKDEEVLFDHMLTVYGARFTSSKLLPFVK